MAEYEGGVKPLSTLCARKTREYLRVLILFYAYMDSSDANARILQDAFQSIPPNFHAEFLDRFAPYFDTITQSEVGQHVLDFIDELAVILLSPYITQIDVDKFKFPTRNPSKYLKALRNAKSLKTFISQRDNIFKYSVSKFRLLASALIRMPLLLNLTLRHLKIPSREINILLEGVASNSPHITYLDLKYSAITDSGSDAIVIDGFGRKSDNVDCIPAILKMKNLRHLNVSETWLSYTGVKAIVQNLQLERLEAIMSEGYDIQAVVMKNLLAESQELPFSLGRKSYSIAQEEQHVRSICNACPLLQEINVQHCYDMNISSYFSAFAELKYLKKITLSGLEWTLHGSHIPMDEEPQTISDLVTEVTLQEPSCVDAHSLGVLSICFPMITHLCVLGSQSDGSEWSRGSVFRRLTHLHFQGALDTEDFDRIQREQGVQSILDVLFGWCVNLRSLTLYTDYLNDGMLYHALQWNHLRFLKELRIGLQRDLTEETLMTILRGATNEFEILGRTDWWTAMSMETRQSVVEILKLRFPNLIVYGLDDSSDVEKDPRPNSFHQRD